MIRIVLCVLLVALEAAFIVSGVMCVVVNKRIVHHMFDKEKDNDG